MKYFFPIFFTFIQLISWAQNYNFSNFYLEEGLSQSQVFDINQDHLGRLWFATYGGGITIFDGQNVEYLSIDDGLPSSNVMALLKDKHNNMWIGTDNGLAYYNGDSIKTIAFTFENNIQVWKLHEDRHGTIWIGSDTKAFIYRNGKVEPIDIETFGVPAFAEFDEKLVISGFESGLGIFDGEHINTNFLNTLDKYYINDIFYNNDHHLVIATTQGVFIFHDDVLNSFSDLFDLPKISALTVQQDFQNRYWIGSEYTGLYVIENGQTINIREDQGIRFNKVEKIFLDNVNNIWIGTDGGGASIFNGFIFTNYTFERILPNNFVWSVLVDSKDRKWFGTDGNGLLKLDAGQITVYNEAKGFHSNNINRIIEDSKKRIWFCTIRGLVSLKNGVFKVYDDFAYNHFVSAAEDKKGNIWFGSYGNGIEIFNGTEFKNFSRKDGLADDFVWDIFVDEEGKVFAGTEEGVTIFDGKDYITYDREDGLADPSVWSIVQDYYQNYWFVTDLSLTWFDGQNFKNHLTSNLFNANVLYLADTFNINHMVLGTEKGLNKISYTQNGDISSIRHFGRAEGFRGIECNANAISRDDKGVFWIGTVNGVSTYDPSHEMINIYPPKLMFRKIRLFYEDVDWNMFTDSVNTWTGIPESLILKHKQNNLTFDFIGINYRNPGKVRYQYILEGNDPNWHPPTSKNEATYTNIPPGEYTFKVKASNEDGIWSSPLAFSFTIETPFWQTTLFILLVILFLVAFVAFLLYFRTYQLQKQRIILSNKVKERTVELNEQKEELQVALGMIKDQKEELESTLVINQKQKQQLEKANIEIQKSAKLKESFLANTSHEIRTPLNVINGYANLLLNSNLTNKQFEYLKNIKISSNNLLVVVDDILDFSKIEAGKLKLEQIEFNLHNLIRDLYTGLSVKANEKQLTLKYSIQNTVPKYVKGDPFRLNQILTNLVRNAIKFTEQGGLIKVIVKLKDTNNNTSSILFVVEDNGVGIDKEKLETIFDSFTQESPATTRKFGGTGLGLSIVKNLVDIQNGEICVESEKNKGSVFSVVLPYEISSGKEIKQKEENFIIDKTHKLKDLKILLVEDNPLNVTLAIDTILMYNNQIKIDVAVNGNQAIDRLSNIVYDLIIMDVQMPEMDGYDTTRYIRSKFEPPKNNIPILGMSAHAMPEEKEKCFQAGMNEYLTKPFIPEDLFSKIEILTGKKSTHKDKKASQGKVLILPETNYIDLKKIAQIYHHDMEKIDHIIGSFISKLPEIFKSLNDSIDSNDKKAIKIAAHSLKTSLNYIGCENYSKLAKFIELNVENDQLKQIIIDNFEELKSGINFIMEELQIAQHHFNEKQVP